MKFGAHIRILRVRCDITLIELSERSDIKIDRLYKLEEHSTVIQPSVEEIEDIIICFTGSITREEIYDLVHAGYDYLPDWNKVSRNDCLVYYIIKGYSNSTLFRKFGIILMRRKFDVSQ